jgi:hypothetical protein
MRRRDVNEKMGWESTGKRAWVDGKFEESFPQGLKPQIIWRDFRHG